MAKITFSLFYYQDKMSVKPTGGKIFECKQDYIGFTLRKKISLTFLFMYSIFRHDL